MWELEYLLLFGVPNNKWEMWDSRIRWSFPFVDREVARAHFEAWSNCLQRLRGCADAKVRETTKSNGSPKRTVQFDGVEMSQCPRPIELRILVDPAVFDALHRSFWRRDLWPGQGPGKETGWESSHCHSDVSHNLWEVFGGFSESHGGLHCGRSAVVLNDRNAVEPDQYYFQARHEECLIDDAYFQGVPRLIAEVLSPSTRALDRGPRMEVYRQVGVPHLWLLDPATETVEEYALAGPVYNKTGHHVTGEHFRPALFPEESVAVDSLFHTQAKRLGLKPGPTPLEPMPKWLVSSDKRVGLEVLFFFGHPEKRYEIWNNRAPCLLAFGSPEEAELRFAHFLEDICRWEQRPLSRPRPIEPGVEFAEVGRFQLIRRGSQVRLDVAVDARKYRQLLSIWTDDEAWDWGED